MSRENKKDKSDLHAICRDLGLCFEPQDWGIINADGERAKEFVLYYEAHSNLSATQKFELGELIIASVNEILCKRGIIDEQLRNFLFQNKHAFEAHMEYWKNLSDASQFPISEWIKNKIY